MNDEVVYFRQGHALYVERFLKVLHPTPPWETFPTLRAQEECRVVQIEYRPSYYGIQAFVTLELANPPPPLPVPPSPLVGEDELQEPDDALSFRSAADGNSPASRRFTVYYHPSPLIDFLVLRRRYESSLEACQVGKRVTVLFQEQVVTFF